MSKRIRQLQGLEQLSRLKADPELRRLAALRAHVDAVRAGVDGMRAELVAASTTAPGEAVQDWRMAHALVGYRAEALRRAEADLEKMRPRLDAARESAARAFGRAEALRRLQVMATAAEAAQRDRRS